MAVLVLQRLLMVSVSVFFDVDMSVSLGMTLISLCWLLLQLGARPYRVGWVNALQAVASACLLLLTILNSSAGAFASAGFDPAGTPLEAVQDEAEWAMVALLFVPPLTWAWFTGRGLVRQRAGLGRLQRQLACGATRPA